MVGFWVQTIGCESICGSSIKPFKQEWDGDSFEKNNQQNWQWIFESLGIYSFFKIGSNSSVTKIHPWKILLLINASKCFIFDMASASQIKWIRFETFGRGFAS